MSEITTSEIFDAVIAELREQNADEPTQAEVHQTREALDELFFDAQRYRTSEDYRKMMEFLRRFRFYSPYNAMLVHLQRPGAVYVATPSRWREKFGRRVNPMQCP